MKPIRPIRPIGPIGPISPIRPIRLISLLAALFFLLPTQAQIKIGGNVYGGGNAGDMTGSTEVTVYAGDINGSVYGGARQANVGGSSFVNIDGEHMSEDILINKVYGGNDISGTIGYSNNLPTTSTTTTTTDPETSETTTTTTTTALLTEAYANGITTDTQNKQNSNYYNAFVLTTPERKVETLQPYGIFIGQLFGGGNGDYTYEQQTTTTGEGTEAVSKTTYIAKDKDNTIVAESQNPFSSPELSKTYLELRGGTFGYVYGGGNNATVTQNTDICIDNKALVTTSIPKGTSDNILRDTERLKKMGIPTLGDVVERGLYHFSRVFGGNNKADMAIQPKWHLKGGHIENLYSGGNEGRMTCPNGLLLEIGESSEIMAYNVYGGCRKADVRPLDANGNDVTNANIQLTDNPNNIPAGFSARTRILGGDITNVYGGNDISGNIYGGNTVAIRTTIHGDVYGGGNGSYAYTDNAALKDDLIWGDYYYDVNALLNKSEEEAFTGLESAEALNLHRPNAEQVSILLKGTEEKPVYVEGAVYVGGNSASLHELTEIANRKAEIKIGSYVTVDKVFLGNNGENMVKSNEADADNDISEGVLRTMASTPIASDNSKFNSMALTQSDVFAKYMEGCAMKVIPRVVFESRPNDVADYIHYTTKFGSFYCGGNVGSMMTDGLTTINFNDQVIVYNKVVGGCNQANIKETAYNAAYQGGLLGEPDANGNKLLLNFNGLKIQPMRWIDPSDLTQGLVLNTINGTENTPPVTGAITDPILSTEDDLNRRLKGGNVYGGCYESGHVNGNVIIDVNESLVDRTGQYAIFDEVETDDETGEATLTEEKKYTITQRHSGVILHEQGMDVFGAALNVFGGGYGKDAEIWGSTTINLNKGYVFQVFGGGEQGTIGKGTYNIESEKLEYNYNPQYSTTINLNGNVAGHRPGTLVENENTDDMAEVEFIYGGGFEGLICGDTHVNLGHGRIYNSFAGSCNADILGHTETYVGQWKEGSTTISGFPWIRDHIYGGCDLGGKISGDKDFASYISEEATSKLYNSKNLTASAYTEYTQGRVGNIFAGCYGDYEYDTDANYKSPKVPQQPSMENAFVNFKPNNNANNVVSKIFGAGQGSREHAKKDEMQSCSYVLIDDANNHEIFANMAVFGAGENCGVGMDKDTLTALNNEDKVTATAVIDLVRGKVGNVYGGSFNQGFTRRTIVNVPAGSTVNVNNIFGGAYGEDPLIPCDVYEAKVNYRSEAATVRGGNIYGGNNNADRTLYGQVNISVPVWSDRNEGYFATIYGAGKGKETWSQYTEVNLEDGARVYEVYGGGNAGKVLNYETLKKWEKDEYNSTTGKSDLDLSMGDYVENGLANALVKTSAEGSILEGKYNTNVYINEGATIEGYCYGGGLGADAIVSGTTFVGLLGGTVVKDIYGSGTSGDVRDMLGVKTGFTAEGNTSIGGFTASTNVYIKGGTVRNVYGGGWRGGVGYHKNVISRVDLNTQDIDGKANVVIGDPDGTSHTNGIPSITRNVYGGGEGGAVFGDAYVTVNNGYIGFRYKADATDNLATTNIDERYVEELEDDGKKDEAGNLIPNTDLDRGGNVFGGGYVANSYTDRTHVTVWNGIVRGGLYGGGEIGPIGRGTVHADTLKLPAVSQYIKHSEGAQPAAIYKGGSTEVELYNGHIMRDVFGGGRGYDNWGGEGYFQSEKEKNEMDRSSRGYVFGSTAVHIYGGEIGTEEGVLQGYGNVFGGGNEGFVYSTTGAKVGKDRSDEHLTNGIPADGGGYYYTDGDKTKPLSHDCYVEVAPRCQVIDDDEGITIGGTTYEKGEYVPVEALNKLKNRNNQPEQWAKLDLDGITIHNALFAGGNITEGSDKLYANTTTVYGNAGASLRDAYNIDLISIGTEDMGGLYGDGNLTLVDGFRELHIDNYGTDYYSLNETMSIEDYQKLTKRQQAYYRLKYVSNTDHTFAYYESKSLHVYDGKTYKRGEKINATTFDSFSADEKANWAQGNKTYQKDDQIEESDYLVMYPTEQANWSLFGVTSIYAGRPMNTIQRADMCGVFGSRMVLKGAQDRVPEAVDYTNYTINRVDEVSLNKRESEAGDTDEKDAVHGNYFGIYSVVNYLGNLTSDVFFTETNEAGDAIRKTDTKIEANQADGTTTYYAWKANKPTAKNRNNGISRNKVALASGVYLEIKREESEQLGRDEWGYITGVIELDLINVMPGMGGGFVYARNEHGTKTWHGVGSSSNWGKVTLLDENQTARTYRRFSYTAPSETSSLKQIETSGNFVHNTKQIIDDCYPNTGMYTDEYVASPAHYWYIRGSIYVYDQYISAYTGSASAYAERVELPLTISAAANGRMTLREVQPNYYAYYDKNGNKMGDTNADDHLIINNETYRLNDPVSYWTYNVMSEADKSRFVEETYLVIDDCTVGGHEYKKGDVLLPNEYTALRGNGTTGPAVTYEESGIEHTDGDFDYFFRLSNNISHGNGYLLTYEVNNPAVWDNYYTKNDAPAQANKLDTKGYEALTSGKADYTAGPTFTPKSGHNGVFGQQDIKVGEIVYGTTKDNYEATVRGKLGNNPPTQATVEEAYIVTKEHSVKNTDGTEMQHLNEGTPIYKSKYTDTQWDAIKEAGSIETTTTGETTTPVQGKVCIKLLDFSSSDYVYAGQLLTAADIESLKTKVIAQKEYTDDTGTGGKTKEQKAEDYLKDYISDAYICTNAGKYGGTYFEAGKAYRAIDTWCSMSDEDRENFVFNYDALDLLVDPTFDGRLESNYGFKPQYDGYAPRTTQETIDGGTAPAQHTGSTPLNPNIYSATKPIDYTAEFVGYQEGGTTVNIITYGSGSSTTTITKGQTLNREEYEAIPNEKHHYSPIRITKPGKYYMVHKAFIRGDIPYTVGQQIDEDTYNSLTTQQRKNIDELTFTSDHTHLKSGSDTEYDETLYFYCREDYKIGEKGDGKPVTTMGVKTGSTVTTYTDGQVVPMGVIIPQGTKDDSGSGYAALVNKQQGFTIHGTAPTETSTLYVSSNSDINDLQKEKIITVIYLYEYEESDESGLNVTPVSERHVVNIHINFKSGVPEIGEVNPPALVLPGTALGLNIPTVTQGAYRVTESGWEIFGNSNDATTHFNGEEYTNNEDPVYWYQNKYYIAYYAKTRLGKTYSNSVPVSVGNYHDLKKVMDDKKHHYYIDHKDAEYEPKIYINDYSQDETGATNGLDLFHDLMDLTHGNTVTGHEGLALDNPGKPIRNAKYLEFFLRADQDWPSTVPNSEYNAETNPTEPETIDHPWTPIADGENECFSGVFHGDGHTISSLSASLFDKLCGDVYNLGVTGSFTGAGVANSGEGYVENCWVKSTATEWPENASKVNAVFGNPEKNDNTQQVVNCYFWDGNKELYNTTDVNGVTYSGGNNGKARAMTAQEFYNGTVAYNLNGFYLWKRYNDQKTTSGTEYKYYTVNADGTLSEPQTQYYANDAAYCSSGYVPNTAPTNYVTPKYVEDRFADGDFRYAGGTIPETYNQRRYNYTEGDKEKFTFYPIWPDDYLFFGQTLNYGHLDGTDGRDLRAHQPLPSAINRSNERVVTSSEGNRVYRAPAYFRSKDMRMAHFNPYAIFPATEKEDATAEVFKNMTAIDFTGGNGDVAGGYEKGLTNGHFYPPLLDYDGLTAFIPVDLTHNLLVYADQDNDAHSHDHVLVSALPEATFTFNESGKYNEVKVPADASLVRGYLVSLKDGEYVGLRNQLLIDKHDFNAPIGYQFDDYHRIWYQRWPNYVTTTFTEGEKTTIGWEGVSLPFTAELVTTDTKGELTHFYSGSTSGHEYWLREFKGNVKQKKDKDNVNVTGVYTADFDPLSNGSNTKNYTNTFLWDWYYSRDNYWDKNEDEYQKTYYSNSHTYSDYPYLQAGTPYIAGFPGETYYEFDLSGVWKPKTSFEEISSPGKQVITFASATGANIEVSDNEMNEVTEGGYIFVPTYLNNKLEAGTNSYVLASDGGSYDKVPAEGDATPVVAFRPYFTPASGGEAKRRVAERIVFSSNDDSAFNFDENDPTEEEVDGTLTIYTKKGIIGVTSSLRSDTEVVIVNTGGLTIGAFTIKPGETIETPVPTTGIYLFRAAGGRYNKKISVK